LWGYKFYKNHKIAISPQYGYAWPFNQYGIAVVRKDPHKLFQQNLINTKGVKIAYCYIFDNGPDYYSKFVLSRIVKNGKMGALISREKLSYGLNLIVSKDFYHQVLPVCPMVALWEKGEYPMMMGGRWGLINAAGKLVVPMEYDSVEVACTTSDGQIHRDDIGRVQWLKGKETYTLCKDSTGKFCAIKMGNQKTGSFGP
jgi:hypothetical protein